MKDLSPIYGALALPTGQYLVSLQGAICQLNIVKRNPRHVEIEIVELGAAVNVQDLVQAQAPPPTLHYGDVCRTKHGTPARYLRDGQAVYICGMDNDIGIAPAVPATGGELRLPLVSDLELAQEMVRRTYALQADES